jgi:hypothetical protein
VEILLLFSLLALVVIVAFAVRQRRRRTSLQNELQRREIEIQRLEEKVTQFQREEGEQRTHTPLEWDHHMKQRALLDQEKQAVQVLKVQLSYLRS